MNAHTNKWTGSDLDRKVYIKTIASIATDSNKKETITWSSEAEVPAYIYELPLSNEKDVADGYIYDSVLRVVIRYKDAYDTTKLRVRYKNRIYNVTDAREGMERRRWLILECKYGSRGFNTGV